MTSEARHQIVHRSHSLRPPARRAAISLLALIAVAVALPAPPPSRAAEKLSYVDLLDHLTNLDRLPVIEPGVYCRQASSYDRQSRYDAATGEYIAWDANADAGNYIRVDPDTREGVMAEIDGPGCIFRIWSANPRGLIRFYLDGATEPTYEWDFLKLCSGEVEPFIPPLAWRRDKAEQRSASNLYLPISFAKSCKVTGLDLENPKRPRAPRQYYILDYRVFPKDWEVETFKLPLSAEQREAVTRTAGRWADSGKLPPKPGEETLEKTVELPPGKTVAVADLVGPATIRQFHAKLHSTEKWATRKVVLRITWDDANKPAVDAPIGDFFGDPKDSSYKSYPMGITDTLNYCYFPMPFRKNARIELVNEGRDPATVDVKLVHAGGPVSDDRGYFHAKWRTELSSLSFDYPLIEATGTGKLVGITLFPHNHHGGWWGEGDEKVYVDGEKFPSWFGTGSEDYFGDAWGIRTMHNPSHGFPQPVEGSSAKELFACYRWHLGDNIPFYKSLRMTIENYAAQPGERTRNDYSSVAYWYQLPGGSDFFEPAPVMDRVPRAYVAQGAIEAERCLPEGSVFDIVESEGLPQPLSGDRGVRLSFALGALTRFEIPVPADDVYNLALVPARGVEASSFELLHDGRPIDQRVRLRKGLNEIQFKFTGKPVSGNRYELIADYFTLAPDENMITEWMIAGPFPNPDRKGLQIVYPPEEKLDLSATYEGRGGKPVKWQKLARTDGEMLLNELYKPVENLVVYGAAVIEAKKPGTYTLNVRSDDGVKVWINGEVVIDHQLDRMLRLEGDRAEVKLKQGANPILVKVEQGIGDVGFAVRFVAPPEDLKYALPK